MATKKSLALSVPALSDDFVPDDYYLNDTEPDGVVVEVVNEASLVATADPFMADEYNDADASYPRIQTLRGEGGQQACWFIPARQLDRAGWLDANPSLSTYHFQGGDKEEGLILCEPRMLVAAKSTPQLFDRAESVRQQRLVLCGDSTRDSLDDRSVYGTTQFFRVYLLSADNVPLAEMPFEYRSKGATRATFVQQWDLSCDEITRFHCKSAGKPFIRKNAVYRSLCVFRPLLAKQKVETDAANVMAAKVVGYGKPTEADWMSYFLGRNENADWFTDVMAAEQPLISGVKSVPEPTELPAGKELLSLPG